MMIPFNFFKIERSARGRNSSRLAAIRFSWIFIIFVANEKMISYYFVVFGFFSHHTSRYGETLAWSIRPISPDQC